MVQRGRMPCKESHSFSVAFDSRSRWATMLHCFLESLREMTGRTMNSVLSWRTEGCAFGGALPGFLLEEEERATELQRAGCEEALARA